MGSMKNILEPLAIASLLTLGAWINRTVRHPSDVDDPSRTPLFRDDPREGRWDPGDVSTEEVASKVHDRRSKPNIPSRVLRKFPFILEIWYWLLIYWVYQGARAVSARLIAGNDATFANAERHAIQLLHLEHILNIDIELSIQQAILTKAPRVMDFLAIIYYSHIIVGVAFYVYSYTTLPRRRYEAIRRSLALMNIFAFCIVTLWRCAPPRLLPKEYGFEDVLHKSTAGSAWTHNKFQLTIAAMPSLHFGVSVFIASCLVAFGPHTVLRSVAPMWPIMMGLTVVATANHFVLDMVVGVAVVASAYGLNRAMLILVPIERIILRMLRLEKPR
ncbi:Uncharacterized protein PECH_003955 [Penicillium ucsense]|uniref:Inositolphosphotransferase Aur1/Ipt1 domain-containing protein n=1 Tax=Penicillium ucsense TaxID=2839758 RepID=A0A8J8WEU6_9EURO|nr:Uncharacterized protein PECM_003522 [Penicillium ucsense]KAF7728961.1 Uncharacterized protein PECH_003955 [Penicillium ucsense]